jgi:hypothetical protein
LGVIESIIWVLDRMVGQRLKVQKSVTGGVDQKNSEKFQRF